MNYKDAEELAHKHRSIIGKPMLNKMVHLDQRKVTSILICPREKIKEIYDRWFHNGHNNKKAVLKIKQNDNFEVFLMSHNPSMDAIIYYLRLNKYVDLGK